MKVLRTPDERFAGLPEFPFAPNYLEVDGLRIHYLDEGPRQVAPVLLMHGEPSWCYLYRKMIPVLVAAGHRVLAPDLVGFGRSDKPAEMSAYSYERHVAWMVGWMQALDLSDITLFGQDWGALIGLRLVAEHGERFGRVVIANGALPAGEGRANRAFRVWQKFAMWSPVFPVGKIVATGCVKPMSKEVRAAYDAPFPSDEYKAGARAFPRLVPIRPDDPAVPANRAAWEKLRQWKKPFLTAFSDRDAIMRGGDRKFQKEIPGAKGQPHTTIRQASHFLQEDKGEEVAQVVCQFMAGRADWAIVNFLTNSLDGDIIPRRKFLLNFHELANVSWSCKRSAKNKRAQATHDRQEYLNERSFTIGPPLVQSQEAVASRVSRFTFRRFHEVVQTSQHFPDLSFDHKFGLCPGRWRLG